MLIWRYIVSVYVCVPSRPVIPVVETRVNGLVGSRYLRCYTIRLLLLLLLRPIYWNSCSRLWLAGSSCVSLIMWVANLVQVPSFPILSFKLPVTAAPSISHVDSFDSLLYPISSSEIDVPFPSSPFFFPCDGCMNATVPSFGVGTKQSLRPYYFSPYSDSVLATLSVPSSVWVDLVNASIWFHAEFPFGDTVCDQLGVFHRDKYLILSDHKSLPSPCSRCSDNRKQFVFFDSAVALSVSPEQSSSSSFFSSILQPATFFPWLFPPPPSSSEREFETLRESESEKEREKFDITVPTSSVV